MAMGDHAMFTSPQRYVQGREVMAHAADYLRPLGESVLILADETVWELAGRTLEDAVTGGGLSATHEVFGGEASMSEIDRIARIAQDGGAEVIVGLGGGKTIDTARAVADRTGHPVAIFPTAASTDAPTSRVSVIYTDDGVFDSYLFYDKNPDLVALDTGVAAGAPAAMLRSGIGDALATAVEGRAVARGRGRRMDDSARPTRAGLALAEACERTLFDYARQALADNEDRIVSPAFENVCEANTLLSGLGFENAGLAAAHAIHNGFTALDGDIHTLSHGEKVAFGICVQLMLEGAPQHEADRYIGFLQSIGLPTTFADLHLESPDEDDLRKVAESACADGETLKQMAGDHSPAEVVEAIKAADRYGRALQARTDR